MTNNQEESLSAMTGTDVKKHASDQPEKEELATEVLKVESAEEAQPTSYYQHLEHILAITCPIVLSEIFQNTLPVVDVAFIGRLPGTDDLAAAALATVWFNLWNSTMMGFMTAIDTLLAQSYGAKEYKTFAMWTGNSLFIVAMVTIIVGGLIALCEPCMLLFGQDPEIAANAGQFSYRLIPGLFPYYAFKVLIKYLQTQNILLPGVLIGLFANIGNAFVNWLLIYQLDLGLNGAPWATSITRVVEFLLIVIYLLVYKNRYTTLAETWPTFCWEQIVSHAFLPFWKLGLNGALSLTAEAWSFEITTILAGLLGTIELDAHMITLTIATFIYLSFPFAVGIATSIRIGQLVGEGFVDEAKRSAKVSYLLTGAMQLILLGILWPCSKPLGKLFSSDEDVADLIADLIPISCVFMLGDSLQANTGGVMRGLGLQKTVLFLNLVGFWVLAVPIGVLLTFVADLGVYGLWWGMVIGIYVSGTIGILLLRFRINWKSEADNAQTILSSVREMNPTNVGTDSHINGETTAEEA